VGVVVPVPMPSKFCVTGVVLGMEIWAIAALNTHSAIRENTILLMFFLFDQIRFMKQVNSVRQNGVAYKCNALGPILYRVNNTLKISFTCRGDFAPMVRFSIG
jgi:hypothetical protein